MSIRLLDMVTWLPIKASGLCFAPAFFCLFMRFSADRFWFFAARNNPDTAPLVTWFNGGVSDTVR